MKRNLRGSLLALSGLAISAATLGLAAVSGGTANAAPSTVAGGDCTPAYPVAQLAPGLAVTGKTVSQGVTPDDFSGEVLGVLQGGIAPGIDMIMVRLTSPEIDRVGGIWAGMSGSPVYADIDDGDPATNDLHLIGAVAYGLSAGPSPVAGVTPFEQMDDYL